MRPSWLGLLFGFCGIGCGSDAEPSGGGGAHVPGANGVAISEEEACAAIVAAEDEARLELGCGPATRSACPDYLRKGREPCLSYDQGTVLGCADYVRKLSTCAGIERYECQVKEIPGSAPGGC